MSKIYFGEDVEQAIERYLECTNECEKKEIYTNQIQPAFEKLVENIINMPKFNFKQLGNFDSLHDEVMAHLYSVLEKFNPNKKSIKTGLKTRAFSYFGTVAKNYLAQQSIARSKISFIDDFVDEKAFISEKQIEDELEIKEFFELLVTHFSTRREELTEDERAVCDAIVFFLNNVNKEILLNKKHFYLLLKEFTGLSSTKLTTILNGFKKEYQNIKKKYYEELY